MICFFDCETTGKADFKSPPEAEHQPKVVQLAALLSDEKGVEIASLSLIVKPAGFSIPQEASSIHGITTEIGMAKGVPRIHALLAFASLAKIAKVHCCHNSDFDTFILRGECERLSVNFPKRETFCTMKAMTDVCKLPGPYGFKWPKLQEAYRHAFGKDFEGAHDALSDVRACKEIYLWLTGIRATEEGELKCASGGKALKTFGTTWGQDPARSTP